MTSETSDRFPLHLGNAEDFARAESLLRSSHLEDTALCQLLRIDSLATLSSVRASEVDFSDAGPRLEVLMRLFLFLEAVPLDDVERAIDAEALASLVALDLVRREAETYCSSVFLYPVGDLLIASDRYRNPDGSPPTEALPDAVFPAVFVGSLRFLRVVSKTPARDALDLCSGSGVAALMLGKYCEHVTACDITARATHFARFNRLLNRCDNVDVLQGDLYQAVEGRSFDRIVAHPPYVPSLSHEHIYRDGGETGESLVRRIVEGLPQYLRPGGSYYSICAGWDTTDGPFEQRVRGWLGEVHREFDVAFGFNNDLAPDQLATQLAQQASGGDVTESLQWRKRFDEAGMQRLVYGALVIHRRRVAEALEPVTARPTLARLSDGAGFDSFFRWKQWRASKEAAGELTLAIADLTPRFGRDFRLTVTYEAEEETLFASEVVLQCGWPFLGMTRVDLWVMPVAANFNGRRTVLEVFQSARDASALPEALSFADFTTLVANMLERGYLEVDAFPSESHPRTPLVM